MKKKYLFITLMLSTVATVLAQITTPGNNIKSSDFAKTIQSLSENKSKTSFLLPIPTGIPVVANVNNRSVVNGTAKIIGNGETAGSSFTLSVNSEGKVTGLYTSINDRKAFKYSSDETTNGLIVSEVPIESVLCIDYKQAPDNSSYVDNGNNKVNTENQLMAIPKFESKPGSQYVMYIDLDGEVSTSSWNSGNTINAVPRSWSNTDVQTIWEIVAQDYITFDINVTTDRAVFDAANIYKKKMCIVTSTTTASPGAGGVAYTGTFSDGSGNPCWAFNSGVKTCGETVSHELGHTVGLSHDGTGSTTYYSGHNGWGTIMGTAYNDNVSQWSMGEYTGANNQQNDINIIGTYNGFAPKPDDVGNDMGSAKLLVVETNGNVLSASNNGLINNRTDVDFFKIAGPGSLNLTIAPFYNYPNLNVQATLLNSSGIPIVFSSPTNSMSATITATLSAGIYYLQIDGVGDGANPTVGYSDYSSIGDYYISGTAPVPPAKPVVDFTVDESEFCKSAQATFTDNSINSTSRVWTFTGGTPATSTLQSPTVTYSAAGLYTVKLVAQNASGKDSVVKTQYVKVDDSPNPPTTTGDSRCGPGTVNFSASGSGGTLEWYFNPTIGSVVNTGTTYSLNLTKTSTYYVQEIGTTLTENGGAVNNTIGAGAYYTADDLHGLVFNVYAPCTLKTVKVYANSSGNREIEIWQGVGGAPLFSKIVNIPSGESRVTLDFALQPGMQYYIKVTGSLVNLYRNSAGAVWPYNIGGLVSITGNDISETNPAYYYYFYDWEVTKSSCNSTRTPVVGTINATPATPTISKSGSVLTSSSATGNQWYLNGVMIPGAINQTHTITGGGDYTVVVTINGCPSPESLIYHESGVGITQFDSEYNFNVYPNPNEGNFTVSLNTTAKVNFKLEIKNALGQLIYTEVMNDFTGAYLKLINVANYGKGFYLLTLTGTEVDAVKKVVVY